MGMTNEYNKIECITGLSLMHNYELFIDDEMYKRLKHSIEQFFDKYGLSYEISPVGGMGGGADLQSVLGILKEFWQYKDYIGAVLYVLNKIFKFIPNLIHQLNSRLTQEYQPTVILHLATELLGENIDRYLIVNRLMNLSLIWENLLINLKEEFPLFNFEASFSLKNKDLGYSITFKENLGNLGHFNKFRRTRIIKSCTLQKGFNITYTFRKLWVTRYDFITKIVRNKSIYYNKKYFLFLSSKIIGS
jgi:hypothetical protein